MFLKDFLQFLPKLIQRYIALKKEHKKFEVVYVSQDQNFEQFSRMMGEMPWPAVPFDDKETRV